MSHASQEFLGADEDELLRLGGPHACYAVGMGIVDRGE
jgi:hypothetical protein